MHRDFELVRKILLAVADKAPSGGASVSVAFPGEYDDKLVLAHVELLIDAGLLDGKALQKMDGSCAVAVRGLTWEGHDFLEVAMEDSLWKRAFSTVKEKGGVMTFGVLQDLLQALARNAAGLS